MCSDKPDGAKPKAHCPVCGYLTELIVSQHSEVPIFGVGDVCRCCGFIPGDHDVISPPLSDEKQAIQLEIARLIVSEPGEDDTYEGPISDEQKSRFLEKVEPLKELYKKVTIEKELFDEKKASWLNLLYPLREVYEPDDVPDYIFKFLIKNNYTYEETMAVLRDGWFEEKCPWHKQYLEEKPANWSISMAKKQLLNIGIELDDN